MVKYAMRKRACCIHPAIAVLVLLIETGLAVTLPTGCSSPASTDGEWQYEEKVEGNVRTVRTTGGSVWQGKARLVEEASIGTADGPDEYLLGSVDGLVVSRDRIYILDSQIPTVRVYDMDGHHLMDISRSGSGPGEFLQPKSLAVSPVDDRLFVRDSRNGRVNVFSSEGDPLDHWRISSTFSTSRPLVATNEGELYTMQLLNPGSDLTEWQMGMCRLGPEGTELDTIPAPVFDFRPWQVIARKENSTSSTNVPYSPSVMWTMAAGKAMVGGVSEDYRFEVRWPGGRVTIIEKEWSDRVPVSREEAQWLRRRIIANFQRNFPGWVWNGRAIPGHKPPFASMVADLSGRVWVGRYGPSIHLDDCVEDPEDPADFYRRPCWESTSFWEVFDLEGKFLGPVDLPEGLELDDQTWIKGDMVVALFTDDEGVPYVKRYRIIIP